jgi:hypothetical protein
MERRANGNNAKKERKESKQRREDWNKAAEKSIDHPDRSRGRKLTE